VVGGEPAGHGHGRVSGTHTLMETLISVVGLILALLLGLIV
jgi:hypothetical protein